MRVRSLLLVALLVAPSAVAQLGNGDGSELALTLTEHPALVVAEKRFPLTVTLESRLDEDREVYLLAALYEVREGEGPCGPATSDRFRDFTHKLQPRVLVPAGGSVTYPGPRDLPWWQVIELEDAPPEQTEMELCVFAAEARDRKLDYYDYDATRLQVRPENGRPSADFSYTPARANVTTPFTFRATASDPEGDALNYTWDFGHYGPKGRAKAWGPEVRHAFYPDGAYTVTLTVTDGFDAATVHKEVQVVPEDVATPLPQAAGEPDRTRSFLPAPGAAMALAAALAAAAAGTFGARRRR